MVGFKPAFAMLEPLNGLRFWAHGSGHFTNADLVSCFHPNHCTCANRHLSTNCHSNHKSYRKPCSDSDTCCFHWKAGKRLADRT